MRNDASVSNLLGFAVTKGPARLKKPPDLRQAAFKKLGNGFPIKSG
jgi:hypothetical protein